jgi:hypothetical protein
MDVYKELHLICKLIADTTRSGNCLLCRESLWRLTHILIMYVDTPHAMP